MNEPVLVADDEPVVLRVLSRMLQRLGFAVDGVSDGRAALGALATGRYQLALLDEQMPGLSGLETAQAIRSSSGAHANIPIVMLTGAAGPAYRARCQAAGINDCLGKPVSLDSLQVLLDRWCHAGSAPEPAAPSEPLEASFDPKVLLSVTGKNPALFQEFCALLRTRSGTLMDELSDAIGRGDTVAVRRSTHQLRGTALMIGATGLGAAVERLEHQERCDASTGRLLERVRGELTAVNERLDGLLGSPGVTTGAAPAEDASLSLVR